MSLRRDHLHPQQRHSGLHLPDGEDVEGIEESPGNRRPSHTTTGIEYLVLYTLCTLNARLPLVILLELMSKMPILGSKMLFKNV